MNILMPDGSGKLLTYRAFFNYVGSVTLNSATRPDTENTVYMVGWDGMGWDGCSRDRGVVKSVAEVEEFNCD